MAHTENYIKWLKSNIFENNLPDGTVELTMPFLDRHNDHIQIYIQKSNSNYKVSDFGYTINDLKISGINFETDKRKELLRFNVLRHGINYNEADESLYIECNDLDLPIAQHKLMQAMLDIDDMFYLSTPNVKSIFFDEVVSFFDKNSIYYSENIQIQGKSGLSFTYDFMLQRNKNNNERLIKLMNSPSKNSTERYLFQWTDTQKMRNFNKNDLTEFYVIINDSNEKIANVTSAFETYGILPIPWTKIDNFVKKLA